MSFCFAVACLFAGCALDMTVAIQTKCAARFFRFPSRRDKPAVKELRESLLQEVLAMSEKMLQLKEEADCYYTLDSLNKFELLLEEREAPENWR